MGDCRKSGRLCTGKIAKPLHTFLKKSSNFYIKVLKKDIYFMQKIPYIFKYQRAGKSLKGF